MTEHFEPTMNKGNSDCAGADQLGFATIMAQTIRDADKNNDGITTKTEIATTSQAADDCSKKFLNQTTIHFDDLAAFAPQNLKDVNFDTAVDEVKNNVWSSFGDTRQNSAGISARDLELVSTLGSPEKQSLIKSSFKEAELEYRFAPFKHAGITLYFGTLASLPPSLICQPCGMGGAVLTLGAGAFSAGRGIYRNLTYESKFSELQRQLDSRNFTLGEMRKGVLEAQR